MNRHLHDWLVTQAVIWTPFLVAFLLGAPWWIVYGGVVPSMVVPLWTVNS